MQKLRYLVPLFLLTITLLSCSSDDDKGETAMDTRGGWELGNFSYSADTSNQNDSTNGLIVIVASTVADNSQGDASGSATTFVFNDLGSGQYNIVGTGGVAASPDAKVIEVSCTIGTSSPNATRYDATDTTSGSATITVEDGKYTVSIASQVTLFKTVEVGTGVPNAADDYPFTAEDIQ